MKNEGDKDAEPGGEYSEGPWEKLLLNTETLMLVTEAACE